MLQPLASGLCHKGWRPLSGICDVRSCHMLKGRKRHLEQGQQNRLPRTLHVICFRCVYVQGITGKSPAPSSQQRETLKANRLGQCFYDATAHSPPIPWDLHARTRCTSACCWEVTPVQGGTRACGWGGRLLPECISTVPSLRVKKLRLALIPGMIPANKSVVMWNAGWKVIHCHLDA